MSKKIGILAALLALTAAFGSAQTIHNFSGVPDGLNPFGGLAVGQNGALYGTTQYGGTSPTCVFYLGCGTVFEMKPPASLGGAWTETVIYSFPKTYSFTPAAPTVGANGKLYGTAYFGGELNGGFVYELTPPSSPGGAWTEATLHSFSYRTGANPQAGVVIGGNGVLYGTLEYAGPYGAVFSLTPPASVGGAWTEQTIYTFPGGDDGSAPLTALAVGKRGELYGTTYFGGGSATCSSGADTVGCGIVFVLNPPATAGGAWTETVIHRFSGNGDGGYPNSVVYRDGVLYGTFTFGGDPRNCGGYGCGGVFQLSPPASAGGAWTESVLYSFSSIPDGLYPAAGVVIGPEGKLYGTTRDGGDPKRCPASPGCGVVFELTRPFHPNDVWRERVLHRFTADDGFWPTATVAIGKDGDLYGTTPYGGTSTTCPDGGCGTVFKVSRYGDWDNRRH